MPSRRSIAALIASLALIAGATATAHAAGSVYQVGAAHLRIDPDAPGSPLPAGTTVNEGGFGLGDGSKVPSNPEITPGHRGHDEGDHVQARAIVVDDGATAVSFVTVETQGMFAAYQRGIPGLHDIAVSASNDIAALGGNLPWQNIVISNDHTHSGPDMIGAWGFVPDDYARFISAQTERAIVQAWSARVPATINAGADDAPDLIYNMTCTEALNQGASDTYPSKVCTPFEESKDGWLRALQARSAADGSVIATMVSYAAHGTEGLGRGLNGDWPQFLSDALAAKYGGVGLAFGGAVGRTQPCRPRCGFTDKATPGYDLPDRRDAYPAMLMYHVERALLNAPAVGGSIKTKKIFIRQDITNPFLFTLVTHGDVIGAPIARSLDAPWTVGNTVRTVVSTTLLGDQLILGEPGEAYPNISAGVQEALNLPPQRVWTLGLADDQLGYLIAPAEAWPSIFAQIAVNDNSIFNVSPTIGDHVMCAQIRMGAALLGGAPQYRVDPHCPAWDAYDSAGDPLGGGA